MWSHTQGILPEHVLSLSSGHLIGGKYRLEERLGEGAIGVVYRTVHVGLDKRLAIKLLKADGRSSPAALERFCREALALGRLKHPNIVDVTDSGIDELSGVPYIVMELLEGSPLSQVSRDQGPLPLAQAFPLLRQIAAAVDASHNAGVLHRDLKPGNVFICSEGPESPSVKVLDFGLAELLTRPAESHSGPLPTGEENPQTLTKTGLLLGTPLYVAPELIRLGKASRSSDIYSFGVLAYEILGGKPPFRGTLEEVLASHLMEEPPPLPLPQQVWCPLRETLEKDPALRPDSAREVVRRLLEGMAEASAAATVRQGARLTRGRMTIALSTILLIVLVLAIGMSPLTKRVILAEIPSTDSEVQKQTVAEPSRRPKSSRWGRPEPSLESRCTASCADDSSVSVTCLGKCGAVEQTCSSSGSSGGYVTCNGVKTSRCGYLCPTVRCEDHWNMACSEPGSSVECYWAGGQVGFCDCIHKWLCGYLDPRTP